MDAIARGARRALLLALLLGGLAACGDEAPSAPEAPVAECNAAAETAQVFGPWILTYEGVRQGCEDARLNDKTYKATPGLELEVSQRQRPGEPDELRLTRSVEGVRFLGSVEGDCVRVDLALGDGYASMGLSGTAADGEIRGRYAGAGPGTCQTSGTFEVKYQQAALRW
jgi:hypothetical protein